MGEEKHDLAAFEIFTHFLVTLYGGREREREKSGEATPPPTLNGTFYYRVGFFFTLFASS